MIGHRAGIAPLNTTAAGFAWRLSEQNPALGVHDLPAMATAFRDRPILERTPNVKTDPCFCVFLHGHVLGFSPGRTHGDSAGAEGVLARRFALLPKTTGRRWGSPAMPAAEPAKTEFCLSKGIPEPRAVALARLNDVLFWSLRGAKRRSNPALTLYNLWIASLRSQ
jgi:hypothetical protein